MSKEQPVNTDRQYFYSVEFQRKIIFLRQDNHVLRTRLVQYTFANDKREAMNKIKQLKRLASQAGNRIVKYTFSIDKVKQIRKNKDYKG